MKIEMDDNAGSTIKLVAVCATACAVIITVAVMVYRYNSLVYEKGYSQVQINTQVGTMWTRPQ